MGEQYYVVVVAVVMIIAVYSFGMTSLAFNGSSLADTFSKMSQKNRQIF